MPTQARVLHTPVGPWSGLGLFSGASCTVRVIAAPAGSGIRIKRTSHNQVIDVPVHISNVTTSLAWMSLPPGVPEHVARRVVRNTVLSAGPHAAATIEHILSALAGLGIADAVIELDAAEVPILDGSAQDFVTALLQHSSPDPNLLTTLRHRSIVVDKPITVRDESGASLVAHPLATSERPGATYTLDYGGDSCITAHSATWNGEAAAYVRDVAPARTFSLEHEALAAQQLGFFKRFSSRDLLVIDNTGNPIDNVWRFPDEPARHKLLDLIGDLALLGRPLVARVEATRSGHALTHQLCRAILASQHHQ